MYSVCEVKICIFRGHCDMVYSGGQCSNSCFVQVMYCSRKQSYSTEDKLVLLDSNTDL